MRAMTRLNLYVGAVLIGVVVTAALVSFAWLPYDPNALDFAAQLSAGICSVACWWAPAAHSMWASSPSGWR